MKKCEVILGLGSNIGDRRANLDAAIAAVGKYVQNIRSSAIIESAALLPENAPQQWDMPFYNMAIAGETKLSPHELLAVIKQIETQMGRNKIGYWSPRNIDIDILSMGDVVIDSPDLTIPHKELLKRDFALKPLLELVPDWVFPTTNNQQPTTKLMGIINITPDSFSDGGVNYAPQMALENIRLLVEEGAAVVDIGAESTRPNAIPITQEEEWKRLEPVLSGLADIQVPISIDTRNPKTAQEAISLGASWINDVSGFANPKMVASVRESDCKLVVMHSLSVPADKNNILPLNCNPVELLIAWANLRFAELEKAGISRSRIIFDAGVGFGKNSQQSLAIIKGVSRFKSLGTPILIGHSRKSFLNTCHSECNEESLHYKTKSKDISHSFDMTKSMDDKDDATLKISQMLVDAGVDYLRVHNIKRHKLELL